MPHQHRLTTDDGVEIAWSTTGGGAPVVLVHGITECAASFDPVVELLAPDHEVITFDLRGHGESGDAADYGIGAMAGDVTAVLAAAGATDARLVGHSLGGAVVSVAGATADVHSVVDIDQSLRLGAFTEQLRAAEPMLRDPATFAAVIDALFESMRGPRLTDDEAARIDALRIGRQPVVLGVWDLLLTQSPDTVDRLVDDLLRGYGRRPTPYLALFGIDPGPDYPDWLDARIPGSIVEVWDDHGHYPHLVDPADFVDRVRRFWVD